METLNSIETTCIDQLLGKADERYFGNGFRSFNSRISAMEFTERSISGTISNSYYGPSRPRGEAPHLGSIEYLTLALRIATFGLNRSAFIGIDATNRSFLRSYDISINDSLEMGSHPFTCYMQRSAMHPDSMQGSMSTFEIHIGRNKIALEVDHQGGRRFYNLPPQETLPQDMENMHSLGYKHTDLQIDDIHYDLAARQIESTIRYKQLTAENTLFGIGSSRESLLSTDATRVFGQLMQVLLYKLHDSDRLQCANIWLRKMSLRLERQHFSGSTEAIVKFDHMREIKKADSHWNLISLSGKVGHYEGKFEVAYKVTTP